MEGGKEKIQESKLIWRGATRKFRKINQPVHGDSDVQGATGALGKLFILGAAATGLFSTTAGAGAGGAVVDCAAAAAGAGDPHSGQNFAAPTLWPHCVQKPLLDRK